MTKPVYLNRLWSIFVLVSVLSCTSKKPVEPQPAATPSPSEAGTARDLDQTAAEDLPFKLYQFLSEDPKNILLSPLSLQQAFALVYLGSSGGTEATLKRLFGFSDDSLNHLKSENLGEGVDFQWGNSVWVRPKFEVAPSYVESISKKLGATFTASLESEKINAWVSKTTQQKIKHLVDPLGQDVMSVFVNAFYFKAPWQKPFEKSLSLYGPFQTSPHQASQVVYLSRQSKELYFEDEDGVYVELPYAGGKLSILMALPKKLHELKKVEQALSAKKLKAITEGLSMTQVDMKIPKFKQDTRTSLTELFVRMGYSELFERGSFARMSKAPNLKISDVIQATRIELDENGTEAAAATAITLETTSIDIDLGKPKRFYANQPFLYLIRNRESGSLYFIGRVYSPETK